MASRNVGCSLRLIISSYQKEREILSSSPPKNNLEYVLRYSEKTVSIYGNFPGTPFPLAIILYRNCHDIKTFLQNKLETILKPVLECIILRHFCRISGLPLLIVLLSMLIASTQDGGIHGYVHGDL